MRLAVVAALALVLGLGIGFAGGRKSPAESSTADGSTPVAFAFAGRIVSLYPDRTGGCIEPSPGQQVEPGADTHCGPLFAVASVTIELGTTVHATQFSFTSPDGAAVQGLLLEAAP